MRIKNTSSYGNRKSIEKLVGNVHATVRRQTDTQGAKEGENVLVSRANIEFPNSVALKQQGSTSSTLLWSGGRG